MGNIADFSDAIARVQVWRSCLAHLEPAGEWQNSPLLEGWDKSPYDFSLQAVEVLAEQLEGAYRKALSQWMKANGYQKDSQETQSGLG